MEDAKTGDLLEKLGNRFSDSVLKICYQMKPASVTAKYIVPAYDKYQKLGAFKKINNVKEAHATSAYAPIYIVFYRNTVISGKKTVSAKKVSVHIGTHGKWVQFRKQLTDIEVLQPSLASFEGIQKEMHLDSDFRERASEFFEVEKALEIVCHLGLENVEIEVLLTDGEDIVSRNHIASSRVPPELLQKLEDYLLKMSKLLLEDRLKTSLVLKGFAERQKQAKLSSIADIYNI